ncbi:Glycerol-3-phosphate transporter [Pteropus alecto]|uniref:Glycerol-3-phosphate transporter n=1 Tax=Pteropus alecto TaxID=9402 RepID=L5KAC3_PTEAL|nr:Glycerol-3-phosphate transporter [Pteropus alecto]
MDAQGALHRYCAAVNDDEVRFDGQSQKASDSPPHQLPDNETDCGWAPFELTWREDAAPLTFAARVTHAGQDNYQQLLGALDYSFLCAYAVGMYLSGIIGERLPIRYYLTFGMLASGAFTALFGLGYFYDIHSFGFYVVTQVVNGLVQTTGWPSVVTCLGNWFGKGRTSILSSAPGREVLLRPVSGRSSPAGYWGALFGISVFAVDGLISASFPVLARTRSPRLTRCHTFGVSDPKDVACSSTPVAHSKSCENGVHRFRLQKQASPAQDPEVQCLLLADGKHSAHQSHVVILPGNGGSGMAAISFVGALKIPGVIEFSLCLLFAKLVSYTFLFWLPLYITNVDHLDVKKAGELSTLFDVGGIFGGILAGVISDRLKKRASTCGLMLLLAAPTLYVFSAVSRMGLEATVAMLLLSGALVSGPYALITTAVSADLGTHKSLKGNAHALATVTAIIDGTGSVGAALGPLLAGLLSPSGWTNVFYMLMFADACALLVSRPALNPSRPPRAALRCRPDAGDASARGPLQLFGKLGL